MVMCEAFGCGNRTSRKSARQIKLEETQKINFFQFPRNPKLRRAWVNAVRIVGFEPKEKSSLCSLHFSEECFDRTSLSILRLKENAVPTIFSSFPAHLQVKEHRRKKPANRPFELSGIQKIFHSSGVQDDPKPSTSSVNEENVESRLQTLLLPVLQTDTCLSNPSTSADVRTFKTKSTSFSPLRRMHRTMSPGKEALLKKIQQLRRHSAKKVKALQASNRRHVKRIARLETVLSNLEGNNLISSEITELLKNIPGPNTEILKRQLAKKDKSGLPRQYNETIRTFALTLHYYSPVAYNYVRNSFDTCLPHPKTLSMWYKSINGEPGFTEEAFNAIKYRAQYTDHPILCSLVLDEMAIRQHVEYDGKKFHGYVDMGTGVDSDRYIAKEALVFMIVAINESWKVPVGYFLVDGVNGEQRTHLVKTCLTLSHNAGIRVVNITFDGAPANFSMAKKLGCNMNLLLPMKTYIQHPETNNNVYIFPDPYHMLKLIRNTLGEKKKNNYMTQLVLQLTGLFL